MLNLFCVRHFYEMPQAQHDVHSVNTLKQLLRYITNYIHNMPCYFVSSGIEIPMTTETFDFIWNSFVSKELTDSETFSSEESYKGNTSAEWRKQDDGYYNRKPNDKTYFQRYYQEKTKQPCVCDICGSAMSCKSNLAKHKKTTKCQRFLVWVHYDFMMQESIIKL